MGLYKEILMGALQSQKVDVYFPNLTITPEQLVSDISYRALKTIKDIIHDDGLSDKDCFEKIEEIICVLEKMGSTGGFRHDF